MKILISVLKEREIRVTGITHADRLGKDLKVNKKDLKPRDIEILDWCPAGSVLLHGGRRCL